MDEPQITTTVKSAVVSGGGFSVTINHRPTMAGEYVIEWWIAEVDQAARFHFPRLDDAVEKATAIVRTEIAAEALREEATRQIQALAAEVAS